MSISASSNKRSTRKRLRRPDPSVTSLCNLFAEISSSASSNKRSMWKRKRIEYTNEMIEKQMIEQGMKMSSSSSSVTPGASTSTSSIQKRFKYDVFLSFRGEDIRKTFVDHLYQALMDKGIYTYKDDVKIQKGKGISDDLFKSIEDSKFCIIVFSKNYASSSWCLDELVKIMECQKMDEHTAYPVFYDVEPTEVRNQGGSVEKAFSKNKNKVAAEKWREALNEAADLAGWELKNTLDGHEAKFIQKIVQEISLELRSINFGFDENLVGMETRVKDVVSSLEVGIDEVRMIGIKGMGGAGKTTTARAVFDHLSADFEAISFVENVREVTNASMFGLKKLQEQVLSKVLNEHVTLDSVTDGKNMMKERMCGKKVLLVLDDVDHIEQLKALAGEPKWFKSGSTILITTRDEQVLVAHGVKFIRDIVLLSEQEAISLFSRYAFGRENPLQGYEELSGKVLRYAAGLPLTIKVLGSFLCGKDKDEWVDAIERLKKIPLEETLKQLELSYIRLEDDYKEIFLDIACILKGKRKKDAIRALESCGFYAKIGLKVLEQRSLITVDKYGRLDMHDHIEEMGKNIVRRLHPDEPNKHSHLWIQEEIEDILANDMGTEATRCLRLDMSRRNLIILMKSLGKMKKLRYLEVHFTFYGNGEVDDTSQLDIPNSLKYLKFISYPFLYLPKTFQANNLVGLGMDIVVGLQMEGCRMVQLWEEGEEKVLKNLKFLSFGESNMTTFDFRITPNLERLTLRRSPRLVELFMPVSCQKLNYLNISNSKLRTFDLGLTPNLETLSLSGCSNFVELHVSVACRNLKSLNLRKLRLRSLDLELIPNLEGLSLGDCNELEEINAPAGCMKKVVHLSLSCCALLEKLPKDIGRFECLEMLYVIRCTKIEYLPDSICMLKRLKWLYATDCCLGKLPEDIGQLESLETLELSSTKIKHLPDSICMLKHLIFLNLSLCHLLEKLPEDLGRLECLKTLHVESKKIEFLPDSICMLKCLKRLNVTDCCRLGKLPEDIGQLECLEELYLSSTKIKHIPDGICMLKNLEYLLLVDCAFLEKLPEDLGRLECLEELDITNTGISHLPQSIFGLKGLHIVASSELLQLYDFPSEIKTTTSTIRGESTNSDCGSTN